MIAALKSGADLGGANLRDANLVPFRDDVWAMGIAGPTTRTAPGSIARTSCQWKVTGETTQSWLCERDFKINKKTMELRQPDAGGWFGWHRRIYLTPADVDDACFVNEHRHRIAHKVACSQDVVLLRQIDAWLTAAEKVLK